MYVHTPSGLGGPWEASTRCPPICALLGTEAEPRAVEVVGGLLAGPGRAGFCQLPAYSTYLSIFAVWFEVTALKYGCGPLRLCLPIPQTPSAE